MRKKLLWASVLLAIVVVLGLVVYMGRARQEPSLRIDFVFDANSGRYAKGFNTFIVFQNGETIFLPDRWGYSGRKGFMDRPYVEYAMQAPDFYADPSFPSFYKPPPKATHVFIGHRLLDPFIKPDEQEKWKVDKIALEPIFDGAKNVYTFGVQVSTLGRSNPLASKEEIESALRVVADGQKRYVDYENRRP